MRFVRAPSGAGRVAVPAGVVLGAASGMYLLTGWVADQIALEGTEPDTRSASAVASSPLMPASSAVPEPDFDIAPPHATSETAVKTEARLVTYQLPLPEEVQIGGDKGLLEINSGGRHKIYVGGVFVGRGPVRRVPLPPGEHEVRIQTEAREQRYQVTLEAGRRVRLTEPRSASN